MISTRLISSGADLFDRPIEPPPMSLWTFFKLISALVVLGVMIFTGMLAYHIAVEPLGGVFAKIIPTPVQIVGRQSDADFVEMLESTELPNIDPGEKAFQKAHEMLAMGRIAEAREKLTAIVNVFPTSSSAPIARRIVGEINLDEILSGDVSGGKSMHVVKSGESFLGITSKYDTSLDCMMHLNSMMELGSLHPGDELLVMPLDFRILIEPRRNSISLWDGGRFIREYPVLHMSGAVVPSSKATAIKSKSAELDGRRVTPQSQDYRAAGKSIQLVKPSLRIRGWDGTGEQPIAGVLLRPRDMEELGLLTRVGNVVEIS